MFCYNMDTERQLTLDVPNIGYGNCGQNVISCAFEWIGGRTMGFENTDYFKGHIVKNCCTILSMKAGTMDG